MSAFGLHEPNMVPANVLFIRMKSCRSILTDRVNCEVIPVSTQVPPLRVSCTASRTSSAVIKEGETTTRVGHHPVGQAAHQVQRLGDRSRQLWVAPNRSADFCLNSTGSTATICAAPLIRAPWIAPGTDPADADHDDGVAGAHAGPVGDRAVTGRDGARQQRARQPAAGAARSSPVNSSTPQCVRRTRRSWR